MPPPTTTMRCFPPVWFTSPASLRRASLRYDTISREVHLLFGRRRRPARRARPWHLRNGAKPLARRSLGCQLGPSAVTRRNVLLSRMASIESAFVSPAGESGRACIRPVKYRVPRDSFGDERVRCGDSAGLKPAVAKAGLRPARHGRGDVRPDGDRVFAHTEAV